MPEHQLNVFEHPLTTCVKRAVDLKALQMNLNELNAYFDPIELSENDDRRGGGLMS